jgi:hypothetical protein
MPARKGKLYLVGRTYVPKEDDRYTPAWHLLRWKKWKLKSRFVIPGWAREEDGAWSWLAPDEEVPRCKLQRWSKECGFPSPYRITKRKWAYVARCGAGKGWVVREVTYGMPDCKKCLRRIR